MEWWKSYFERDYLHRHPVDHEQTVAEVLMLRDLLPEAPADLLDVGCGAGRHSVALALAGYHVIGLDASAELLEEAHGAAEQAGAIATFVTADMRAIPYSTIFDAAISMGGSFGYFDEAGNRRHLAAMARALKPGGHLVMELPHRDQFVASLRETDWYELADSTLLWVRRRFDAISGICSTIERWRDPDGQEHECSSHIRIYSATELERMLRSAGLTPLHWFGSINLHAFGPYAPRMVVVAERVDSSIPGPT